MSGHSPKAPDFRRRVEESFALQTVMATIGASLSHVEAGRCAVTLPMRADLCQQHGYLHAGITTTLADTAAGYAALSLMPAGAEVLSTEFKINLLNPAAAPLFVARAEVLKSGRTLSVVRSDVWGEGDDRPAPVLIATMLATMICLSGKG